MTHFREMDLSTTGLKKYEHTWLKQDKMKVEGTLLERTIIVLRMKNLRQKTALLFSNEMLMLTKPN